MPAWPPRPTRPDYARADAAALGQQQPRPDPRPALRQRSQLGYEKVSDPLTLTGPLEILREPEHPLDALATIRWRQPQRVLTELCRVTRRASRSGRGGPGRDHSRKLLVPMRGTCRSASRPAPSSSTRVSASCPRTRRPPPSSTVRLRRVSVPGEAQAEGFRPAPGGERDNARLGPAAARRPVRRRGRGAGGVLRRPARPVSQDSRHA